LQEKFREGIAKSKSKKNGGGLISGQKKGGWVEDNEHMGDPVIK